MWSLKLFLVAVWAVLPFFRATSVGDEVSVTYQFITFNYSVTYNEIPSEDEVCRKELLSNMTKKLQMYMDESVEPCDNFYKYVCGKYNNFHSPSYKLDIHYQAEKRLNELILEFLNQPLPETYNINQAETKARVFYKTCRDMATIRKRGVEPLKELIASLGGWHVFDQTSHEDDFDLLRVLKKLQRVPSRLLFRLILGFSSNSYEVSDVVLVIPGSTFLPKPSYRNSSELHNLKKFLKKVLVLSGAQSHVANVASDDAVWFDGEISKLRDTPHSETEEQNLTLGELQSLFSFVDWTALCGDIYRQNLSSQQKVRLTDKTYFEGLAKLIQATPKRILVNYIYMRTFIFFADLVEAGFDSITSELELINKPFENPKYCEVITSGGFRNVINAYALRNYFRNSRKDDVAKQMALVRNVVADAIEGNKWLDSKTKIIIRYLLSEMVLNAGHSENTLNKKDDNIVIIPGKFFESSISLREKESFLYLRMLNKNKNDELDNVVSPVSISAFYIPIKNEATITTPMMQPPFYHPIFPKAINFGGLGVFMAHEIAHGIDNNGTWTKMGVTRHSNWTTRSMERFDKLAECFVEQFNNYNIYNLSVNGSRTLNENMADTTGIMMAFRAYLRHREENPFEHNLTLPKLNMTDKQLFFVSYAHSWCSADSVSQIKRTIQYYQHSPTEFRVIGSLSNSKEFAETFNCPVGTNMNPAKKCAIW